MKKLKSLLPAIAFVFAVGGAFAFKPASVANVWEANDSSGTGCTSSTKTACNGSTSNCIVSGKYLFSNSNCTTAYLQTP